MSLYKSKYSFFYYNSLIYCGRDHPLREHIGLEILLHDSKVLVWDVTMCYQLRKRNVISTMLEIEPPCTLLNNFKYNHITI